MHSISGKADMGRLFENAVFLELKRRISQTQNISYWRNKEGIETDFVVREGLSAKEIIQVVYETDSEKTKEREIRGLLTCANELGLKNGLVITKSKEGAETIDGIELRFVPLRKWLLE